MHVGRYCFRIEYDHEHRASPVLRCMMVEATVKTMLHLEEPRLKRHRAAGAVLHFHLNTVREAVIARLVLPSRHLENGNRPAP